MAMLKPAKNFENSGFHELVQISLNECLTQSDLPPPAGLAATGGGHASRKPPHLSAVVCKYP